MFDFTSISFIIKASVVIGILGIAGYFYHEYTLKDEQIKSLTSENSKLNSEKANLAQAVKEQNEQLSKMSTLRDKEDSILKEKEERIQNLTLQLNSSKKEFDKIVSNLMKVKPNDPSVTCTAVDMDPELYNWMLNKSSSTTDSR